MTWKKLSLTVSIVHQNTKSNCIDFLLTDGKRLLASKNIGSSALDAALLLAEVSVLSREKLITHNDHTLNEMQCRHYYDLLERRCRGESIAYIVGRKEFWGLEFSVSPAVLVPRPDTEILVEAALNVLGTGNGQRHFSLLDLCTGCGAVAIAIKHTCPDAEVWAADISEEALIVARKNAETLGCTIIFLQGDLYNALNQGRRFFLITANAPYIPSANIDSLAAEVRNEPRLALDGGIDGLDIIRQIIAAAPQHLEAGGSLVLEADPSQMEVIAALMKCSGFSEPVLHQDLGGNNRVIAATSNNFIVSNIVGRI